MPKLKAVERRIAKVERFNVKFRHADGRDVRSNKEGLPMYPYKSAAKNDFTVGQWRAQRFNRVYPGFEITVSWANGSEAHGATKLSTLRNSYGEPANAVGSSESQHLKGKPDEVVELFRALDRMCQDLAPGRIVRVYKAKHVTWSLDKAIFCSACVWQSGLRVYVKTDPKALDGSLSFARDVSEVGHYCVGDVELAIDSLKHLDLIPGYIRASFENATRKMT